MLLSSSFSLTIVINQSFIYLLYRNTMKYQHFPLLQYRLIKLLCYALFQVPQILQSL